MSHVVESKLVNFSKQIAVALSSRIMELVILPTEDCNFRCVYCFEDHVPGKMAAPTVQGIKRLLERRIDDLTFLRISWFGGEPLAARNVVLELSDYATGLCRERGVEFAGDVTTNGYLLAPALVERLVAARTQLYFVSLAGVGEEHDRWRPLASGRGSFQRIWDNLVAMQHTDLDFVVSLRLHFTPDLAKCEELCRVVNRQFGGDPRFHASLQRVADIGGANSGRFATIRPEDTFKVASELARFLPDVLVDGTQPKKDFICYAARPNNMVIRPDGRIARCVAHLEDPRNDVGYIDETGHLHLDAAQYQPWLKGLETLDERMLACPQGAVPRSLWPAPAVPHAVPFAASVVESDTGLLPRAERQRARVIPIRASA